MKLTLIVISSVVSTLTLFGCSNSNEGVERVSVYVSADEQIAREVFAAFTDATGIHVDWVGDSESSKNTTLVQRLIREKDNPVADVFWSSEILGTILLSRQNIFAVCNAPNAMDWPENHRDSKFHWFGFSPRARVIAYNPKIVSKEDLPMYWWEYSDAVMADPRFGTTRTHVNVMAAFPQECMELFENMEQSPLYGGNAATVQAVVDGRATFAMTDTDDVHAAIRRGASIAMHMPRHHDQTGGGTLLIPNTVGVIADCSQPEHAAEFVNFLLSDEVATLLALSTSHNIPIQESVASKFPHLIIEDPLDVDFYSAASVDAEQIAVVMDVIAQ